MTQIAIPNARPAFAVSALLYPVTVFASAALVFSVEPLIGRLILPELGGGPSVWNTSMAFFQAMLLAGYLYAHLLRRIASVRVQALVHLLVLLAAAATLPLKLSAALGPPPVSDPALWLVGQLLLTVGAPFAALSATAPLLQSWCARHVGDEGAGRIYGLYAASNLGSLLALAAYPFLIEPNLTLAAQRGLWTGGYWVFAGLLGCVALALATGAPATAAAATATASSEVRPSWARRGQWVLLAAAPSSLMLGVTAHLSSDVGSFPFLWIAPLALYLLTFVLAFRDGPGGAARAGPGLLLLQAGSVLGCLCLLALPIRAWPLQLALDLCAFFTTALVCHLQLVARKPGLERLTEFYLWMSVGGVVGGLFNAFVAPAMFDRVWEYPLVLVLACLARPAIDGARRLSKADAATLAVGLAATAALVAMLTTFILPTVGVLACTGAALASALLLRGRPVAFTLVVAGLALAAESSTPAHGDTVFRRSFFGVHRVVTTQVPGMGPVRELMHGSTLHGAQMLSPERRCTPMTYYAAGAPLAQAFDLLTARKPAASIGVVGLGAGSLAAWTRAGDDLTFFEIDPAVVRIARDDGLFSFVGPACAHGRIAYVLGDGRLTLERTPGPRFDLLAVDAFSSDAVPTHLLTTQALTTYLDALKPGGVLVLHLSNRNLSLVEPTAATARSIGAYARVRSTVEPLSRLPAISSSSVMVLSRTPADLAAYTAAADWSEPDATRARAWTDDYTNVLAALGMQLKRTLPHAF